MTNGDSALDPCADDVREWLDSAAETLIEYLSSLRECRLYPHAGSRQIRERLERELPLEGVPFSRLLETFRDVIVPMSRRNSHPRMFGYVQSPGTVIAAVADLLASTLNANLTAWRSAPAPVEIERLTIDWIRQILGFDEHAAGIFVSGGSQANLAALAAARRAKARQDLADKGARSLPREMRIYASQETHHSITKAAALLGIGRDNVREVNVDPRFRIRVDDLVAKIEEDVVAGHQPFCVVANAGTVNTGACDPLGEVREVARRFNLWMHVDASYGGFAILADSARGLLANIEQADSVALDPHKWLYLPVDCGCVIYRDAQTARDTFAQESDYTRVLGYEADEAFAFWDYGPELSRRFRALKVWMLLKGVGLRRLGEAIEKDLACARHFQSLVRGSDDFEMLAPVELSIFCFRYVPQGLKQALANESARRHIDVELDSVNERLLLDLQRDGSSYLSNTRIGGRFSLRGCVLNYRTTMRDMEILLADLRRLAEA